MWVQERKEMMFVLGWRRGSKTTVVAGRGWVPCPYLWEKNECVGVRRLLLRMQCRAFTCAGNSHSRTKIGQSQNRYLVTTWYCAWFFVRSSNHSYTISLHKLRKEELKGQPVAQRSRTNIIRSTYKRIQGPNKSETCTLFDDFFRPPQVDDGAKIRPIQNHFLLKTRT